MRGSRTRTFLVRPSPPVFFTDDALTVFHAAPTPRLVAEAASRSRRFREIAAALARGGRTDCRLRRRPEALTECFGATDGVRSIPPVWSDRAGRDGRSGRNHGSGAAGRVPGLQASQIGACHPTVWAPTSYNPQVCMKGGPDCTWCGDVRRP